MRGQRQKLAELVIVAKFQKELHSIVRMLKSIPQAKLLDLGQFLLVEYGKSIHIMPVEVSEN